jgi:hypothetical protein
MHKSVQTVAKSLQIIDTGEGRKRAMAAGVKFGRKRKLSDYQRAEASSAVLPAKRSPQSPRATASIWR